MEGAHTQKPSTSYVLNNATYILCVFIFSNVMKTCVFSDVVCDNAARQMMITTMSGNGPLFYSWSANVSVSRTGCISISTISRYYRYKVGQTGRSTNAITPNRSMIMPRFNIQQDICYGTNNLWQIINGLMGKDQNLNQLSMAAIVKNYIHALHSS